MKSTEINFFLAIEKLFPTKGVIILLYHQITPKINEKNVKMAVSPELFARQMAYVAKKHYPVISLNDFFVYQAKNIPFSSRHIILTFDDGFKDNYLYALPILKKYNFKATIFLSTDFIGSAARYSPKLDSWTMEKEKAEDSFCLFLSWNEIKDMARQGIDFGSHTCSHPYLTRIPSLEAEQEIKKSKKIIENNLGQKIKFFSYPFGEFNKKIEGMVKRAGFSGACTAYPGGINNILSNPYSLVRHGISGNVSNKYFDFVLMKYYKFHLTGKKIFKTKN
jgi:peptidoglycan/xylan/chitin deacetylase (PgdA/CDA1 family)